MRHVHAAAAVAALVTAAPVAAFYETGVASIYGPNDPGGRVGPTGERINHTALTAAHKTLPLGTLVEVTNERNGRAAVVKITDRGPYVRGRIIDLTTASGTALGVDGLDPVRIGIAPAHGCTFAERYSASLIVGHMLARGRSGCALAYGEIDDEERAIKSEQQLSGAAASFEKGRRVRAHHRERWASRQPYNRSIPRRGRLHPPH
jgi:rare lipoprotein A